MKIYVHTHTHKTQIRLLSLAHTHNINRLQHTRARHDNCVYICVYISLSLAHSPLCTHTNTKYEQATTYSCLPWPLCIFVYDSVFAHTQTHVHIHTEHTEHINRLQPALAHHGNCVHSYIKMCLHTHPNTRTHPHPHKEYREATTHSYSPRPLRMYEWKCMYTHTHTHANTDDE